MTQILQLLLLVMVLGMNSLAWGQATQTDNPPPPPGLDTPTVGSQNSEMAAPNLQAPTETPTSEPTATPTPTPPVQKLTKNERRVRTHAEAISEWIKFRRNEHKYAGTITTWRLKVSGFTQECPYGYIGDEYEKAVLINGPENETYEVASSFFHRFPVVKKGDWIVVTGEFQNITEDNYVVLEPIKVKNEGYE